MQAETIGDGPGSARHGQCVRSRFGRLLTPQDVANLAVFLLSDAAGPMTGALIDQEQRIIGALSPRPGRSSRSEPDCWAGCRSPCRSPAYDRLGARASAWLHIGVGAFHRCHQGEYTDDLLGQRFDRWGVVGINIRDPRLADARAPIRLYTRLLREDDRVEARVIGSVGLGGGQPGKRGSGAGNARISGDRRSNTDRDREGLLPHTV